MQHKSEKLGRHVRNTDRNNSRFEAWISQDVKSSTSPDALLCDQIAVRTCTCTPAPGGSPLDPNPEASGLAWRGSVSAASGPWMTPAAPVPEVSQSRLPLAQSALERPEVAQARDDHWGQELGASERSPGCHPTDLHIQVYQGGSKTVHLNILTS